MTELALPAPDKPTQVLAVPAGHVHTAMVTTFTAHPLLVEPGIASALRLYRFTALLVGTGAGIAVLAAAVTRSRLGAAL